MDNKISKLVYRTIVLIVVVMMIVFAVFIAMKFKELGFDGIKELIVSYNALGWLVIIVFQIIQIIIAIIPGGILEMIAGALYGGLLGISICLIGTIIGTALAFMLSRKFGRKLIEIIFSKNTIDKMKYFEEEKKLERATFILFLIPGVPKDLLSYMAGLTKIKMSRFLFISTIARLPAIISSAYMASHLAVGNNKEAAIIFIASGTLSILAFMLNAKLNSRNSKNT